MFGSVLCASLLVLGCGTKKVSLMRCLNILVSVIRFGELALVFTLVVHPRHLLTMSKIVCRCGAMMTKLVVCSWRLFVLCSLVSVLTFHLNRVSECGLGGQSTDTGYPGPGAS